MKRFLGILVASMFLASAAYAADAMKEEKKADAKTTEKKADAKASEKKADSKAKAAEKKTDGKAKAADTKAGAMGEQKKSEMAKEKTADKPATK